MSRYFLYFLVSLSLLCTSCYHTNEEEVVIPEKILSPTQLTDILTQLQLAEGRLVVDREKQKDFSLMGEDYAKKIYQHFGITPEQLVENLNYYQNQEDILIEIYDKVLANLSELQEEVKIRKEEELKVNQAKEDSIRMSDSLELVGSKDSMIFKNHSINKTILKK